MRSTPRTFSLLLGLALGVAVASCTFEPDLSCLPPCETSEDCPPNSTCLPFEKRCLPSCMEHGGPCHDGPGEGDGGRPPRF